MNTDLIRHLALLGTAMMLAACGGGAGTSANTQAPPGAACDPANAATFDECGTVLLGLTDADGDFLNYTVDIRSLTLETANGRVVEILPAQTRLNFADYVELTELVTAVAVPPAVYVAGTVSLDYNDAEILVAFGDGAKATIVTDLDGKPLTQTDLKITLPDRDQLIVSKRRAHFLQLDFDLEASHEVDTSPDPAIAAISQFILAEVHPVDEKGIRVRGPLVSVNEDEMAYVVAIRPFHDRLGDFGPLKVTVTDATEFEVNEQMFVGIEGLRALAAAGTGTPTVARGTLTTSDRRFIADIVLAGASVPGHDADAVVGNIIERDGNFLTIRGATVIPRSDAAGARVHFHDDVVVEIGPDTRVFKDGYAGSDLDIGALSIGQRVTVRGNQPTPTTDALAPQILFDATRGAVRMHVTSLSGIVNSAMPGETEITLHAVNRRRVEIFNFSGTGASPDLDANPDEYQLHTDNLTLADFAAGKPIVARGFPTPFGMAPPDFTGRSVIDYTEVRSALGVGWGKAGTLMPFVSLGPDGIVLNNDNDDIDERHYISQGPVFIDLTSLDSDTALVPRESGRMLFSIASRDSLRLYADFADFAGDLATSLDGSTTARSLYARGKYDPPANVFTAYKLGVYLLEP